MKRKYIQVIYDNETQAKLRSWCIATGFDLTKNYSGNDIDPTCFVFHTTIFYSENLSSLANKQINTGKLSSQIVGFKLLGQNNNIPVLLVDSKDLKDIRKYYEILGLKDKWPEWIPHISLSYADQLPDNLSNFAFPDFDLYFDTLVIEDIDEEI